VPTIGLKVQADGFFRSWDSLVGGDFGYEVVGDSDGTTHDSDTTYLLLGKHEISFPIFLQAEGLFPMSLTINVAAKRDTQSPILQIGLYRGGTAITLAPDFNVGATYSVESRSWTTNPFTGSAWKPADLVGLEAYVKSNTIARSRVTLVSGLLTYVPGTNALGARPWATRAA
jgi:hypothetical protein